MSKKDTPVQEAPQEQEAPKARKPRTKWFTLPRLNISIEAESAHHAVELANQQKGNG